jgi:hypothetical protein
MNNANIHQEETETQAPEEIVCILCEGSHGNNTWCQATIEWSL